MLKRTTAETRTKLSVRCVFCWLFILLLCARSYALDPTQMISQYGHVRWRVQEGYLPGMPEVIVQTTDGYIWIGTYIGLVRFDGVKFVPWPPADSNQLPDLRIYSLLGAKDGSLWIGTANGLARWKDGGLTNYPKPSGRINDIAEDQEGNIWTVRSQIESGEGALCRVSGNDPKCFGEKDGVPLPFATHVAVDTSGYLWIGGQAGLCRWKSGSATMFFQRDLTRGGPLMGIMALNAQANGDIWISHESDRGTLELLQFTQGKWQKHVLPGVKGGDPGISALYTDRDGALWVGTARLGIYRIYQGKTDHFSRADGLTSDAISHFLQDREGTLWVTTSQGVDSFRTLPVVSYSIREGLTADSVSTVLAAHDGGVWIGNSGALDFLKDNKFSSIRTGHGLPGRDVITMFEDHLGRLWLGIDVGFYMYDGKAFHPIMRADGTSPGIVFAIAEDTRGDIWARAGSKLICVRNQKIVQEISDAKISTSFSIKADPKEGFWLGFVNGDLGRYHGGRLEILPAEPAVSTAKVRQIIPDSDESVWGVTEKGLLWWHQGKHAMLTMQNGLPCNELYTGIKDEDGSTWFYSRCGVVAISDSELRRWQQDTNATVRVRVLDVYDGAQAGVTPLQPQSTRSRDGRLWFADDTILQTISPKDLPTNSLAPNVVVEGVVADGKSYQTEGKVELPALIRNLQIDYTALSFLSPQKVRFRYKLEGHDTEWLDPHTRRQAFYGDLAPGKYRFRVIACNNDGVWNEAGAAIEFSVAPAFFQTAWFVALCFGVFGAGFWFLYQMRLRRVASGIRARMEERLGERERIARELHDTFLQSVQGLILRFHAVAKQISSQEPARETLEKALDRADSVLSEGRDRVRNLRYTSSSIGNLSSSFRRAAEECAHGSEAEFKVVMEGMERQLQPLVLEEVNSIGCEAIINAFRHSGALHIEVEIIYDSKLFRLRVRDDGCGIAPDILQSGGRTGHWGLQGMRERARRIGAQLDLWSRAGSGTEVELRIAPATAYRPADTRAHWQWLRAFTTTSHRQ